MRSKFILTDFNEWSKHSSSDFNRVFEEINDYESRLAGSKRDRWELAVDPNTPVDILTRLSQDEDWVIRMQIVSNPNIPAEALSHLSQDENERVRCWVAANHKTPIEALVRLSRDEDDAVRRYVETNPKWSDPANQEKIEDAKYLIELGLV
jgi:hypothetical protein